MNPKALFEIDGIPLLTDMVLVEQEYPVLFTCISPHGEMYVVVCFRSDGEKKEWLIAKTTPDDIWDLLQNGITMRSLFENSTLFLAEKREKNEFPSVKRVNISDIPEENLPTAGVYMEADEEEFLEEIGVLKERILSKAKASIAECKVKLPGFISNDSGLGTWEGEGV